MDEIADLLLQVFLLLCLVASVGVALVGCAALWRLFWWVLG